MWHLSYSLQGLKNIIEGEIEKLGETEFGQGGYETVSSSLDITFVHMISIWLCLTTQDLHKTGPVTI